MAVQQKSKAEKIGSGLGLVTGIILFNLVALQLFEKTAGVDWSQMLLAGLSAALGSELGARIGKRFHNRANPPA